MRKVRVRVNGKQYTWSWQQFTESEAMDIARILIVAGLYVFICWAEWNW